TGRRRERAEQIAAGLRSEHGTTAITIEADLNTPEGTEAAVELTEAQLGPVDILVLNGPGPKPGAAATLEADELAAAFELLVRPHHALVSKVLPGMRERRWGRVLAIGSSGVQAPPPHLPVSNTRPPPPGGDRKT